MASSDALMPGVGPIPGTERATLVLPRKRRNVELLMVLFAVIISVGAYVQVNININGALPPGFPYAVGIFTVLALVAHFAVRWRLPYADPLILPCAIVLNGLGLSMLNRIDLANDPPINLAQQQLLWTSIGVLLFVGVAVIIRDHRPLQGYTYTLGLSGLILLLLPLVPVLGVELNDSRIWIRAFGMSFQPAEIAKVFLSLSFASYLVEKRDVLALAGWRVLGIDLPRLRDLGPILLMWLASVAVLIFENDLGTSLLFFGLFVMMLYVSTERAGWAVLGTLLFIGGGALAYLGSSRVRVRVGSWLTPFDNYQDHFQVINAQFGLAYGGLLGTGLGLGRPGLTPLARSDFIATSIGEELGMTGLMGVIMIFGLIVARGLRTALACREPFGKLLATGLSFAIALQVFTIIGGVTRLLPLTGLTTPFMSQGGSSLVANWVIIGLLLVVSHQVRKPIATTADFTSAQEVTQVIAMPR